MKLITKALEERFEKIGEQSQSKDPIIVAKFFNPCGSQAWYATEFDKQTNICFGYVTGVSYDQWATFSIEELESVELPYWLKIERDIFFKETHFKELFNEQIMER